MTIKRIVLLIIPTLISLVFLAVGYVFSLRQIAVQGNELFIQRCTTVNPPLIMYKKSFLQFASVINSKNLQRAKEAGEYMNIYLNGIKAYEPQEKEWLQQAKKYQDNPAFTLLYPDELKTLINSQWEVYNAYYDEAVFMHLLSEGKVDMRNDLGKLDDIRARRYEYEDKADSLNKQIVNHFDFRYKIISLPKPSECTDENTIIPATEGSIDWGDEATPSSEPIPTLIFGIA